MAAHAQANSTTWDPEKVLGLISPATGNFCCVGWTVRNRRCTRQLAWRSRDRAGRVAATLPEICHDGQALRARLKKLAELALCHNNHQDHRQITNIFTKWMELINEQLAEAASTNATGSDDLEEEIARLQRELEELRRRQEQQRAHERHAEADRQQEERRQREEARRQAEEEARRQEEERRCQEEEQARQRQEQARRQQEANQRRQEDAERARESRQRAEAQARAERQRSERERLAGEWAETWARYERDWEHIDTADLDEDIRESIPWPVKNGRWQDVNEGNVRAFYRHAPNGASENPRRFKSLLIRQALRWHGDKLCPKHPRVARDGECLRLATIVAQVIIDLMRPLPSL